MRFLLFFAIICFAASLSPARLSADTLGCNEYIPARIDVKPLFDDVDYDFSQPMIKIRTLSEEGETGVQSESWPIGLSVGQLYMRITINIFKSRTAYDPSTCSQIKAIHVELGFVNNKIYVAHELPKRSCPYKGVLAHEEKHKAVDQQLVEEYTEKAQTFFDDAAKAIGVLRNASGTAAETQINDLLNQAMDQFTHQMEEERKKRQKEVDSAEEYARVTAACEGHLMEIVQQRLELLEEMYPGVTKRVEQAQPAVSSRVPTTARARPSRGGAAVEEEKP
ncbi:MAG: hypothetical protein HY053_07590 [Proteobacteria bacterium]|nr:hypothetical protein [Pseudomonadota bacterium]